MGIETTSFAALLAAAGIAIGSAWSGLLANFAAGIFLLVLRPFRVGDEINAGGVTGMCRRSACSSPPSTRRTTCASSSATAGCSATTSSTTATTPTAG